MSSKRFISLLFGFIALTLLDVNAAHAREEILLFDSTVQVRIDGVLNVEEKIRVRAEGRQIRRGIFRDFPVRSKTRFGLWDKANFKVIEILRDGVQEPYFIESHAQFERVYIGNKDRRLPPGVYTYTLRYETAWQLRYFDEFDELYWNATGNFWRFPIRKAISRVVLPDAARIKQKTAYTGPFGARGKNYRVSHEALSSIVFETTDTLQPGEGMSVVVGWQKGIVSVPTATQSFWHLLTSNFGFALLLFGLLGLAKYFFATWAKYGRDPQGGTIIPLFYPPEGLSPAAVSYVHYQGFKKEGRGATKPLIAAMVSLAMKGFIKIREAGDSFALQKVSTTGGKMGKGERTLFSRLLAQRDEIVITEDNGPKLKSAQNSFNTSITSEYEGVFFKKNFGLFAIGLGASIALFMAFAMFQNLGEDQVVACLITFIIASLGTFILMQGLRRLFGWHPGGGSTLLGGFFAIIGGGLLGLSLIVPFILSGAAEILMAFGVAAIGVMNVLFFFLIRAPTPGGRKVMDGIEGFKLYLSVAEAERMNMADAPDVTQDLYEEYLPYAIGLGVEEPWSEAFASQLARAIPDETSRTPYRPRWYAGSNWNSGSLGRMTTGFVDNMSSSMASAMPAPKSSSGSSGGGGFSGGGGGGGGGGGW
ncbi:MAG: DUF2207 domain-containing protein [Hyphomicrobiales bacterium]